jgi:hypothetical protein
VLAAPVGTPWMWTLAFGQHEDRTPTHGYDLSLHRSDTATSLRDRGRDDEGHFEAPFEFLA